MFLNSTSLQINMSPNTIQKHWMRFIFKFSHFAIDWIDPQRSFLLRPPVPLN